MGTSLLDIELLAYRFGFTVESGGLGKAAHFKRIVQHLWGKNNKNKEFIWHPWAEEMAEAAAEHSYLGVSGAGSSGKCLAPQTPVLMFDGSVKTAGEIRVGDQLMGDDSIPRNVLSVNTGRSNMVRIVPARGDPWECNDDHMLTLKRVKASKRGWRRVGEITDISVKAYLRTSQNFKEQHKLFCKGVVFQDRPVEFDPRVYGLWLGDGAQGAACISSREREVEVNAFIRAYFSAQGYGVKRMSSSQAYYISTAPGKRNPFLDFVRTSSGVGPRSKRILPDYLYNSRAVRLELLAGILDADGHAAETHFSISSSYPSLSEDIVYLARSLGFRVTVTPVRRYCKGRLLVYNVIRIMGDVEVIPTLRKRPTLKYRYRNSDCSSFFVEQLGEGAWAGFTLDGNGRFLLGDFTVTHNTDFFSVYGIVNYICAPSKTLVLMTSTSLKEARKRCWGATLDYWSACPGLPGRVIDSQGMIRLQTGSGKGQEKFSDRCGISLIAAERKQEREAIGKLIGLKQQRVIFIGDEMPELSEAILEACYTNLSLNPEFQLICLGNFKSVYDAFGLFVKPKAGYQSITVADKEWETDRGVCLHFDALESPNWLGQHPPGKPWPIIKKEQIQDAIDHEGVDSPGFWRMFRSFPCPGGSEQSIYSEADLIKFKAEETPIWQGVPKIRVAGLDPSFSMGGDRAPLVLGWYGRDRDGRMVICADEMILLKEDVTKTDEPRNYQIARQFREVCEKAGVAPENSAYDGTGAGGPFGDIVSEIWSRRVLRVLFGGRASEIPFSAHDPTPASKKCVNRVTELWYAGLEFMRHHQLKGIFPALAKEMCAREFTTEKAGEVRLRVETKEDMKSRIGKSPDIADAFFVMVDLCRDRLGAMPGGEGGLRHGGGLREHSWKELTRKFTPRSRRLTH